MLLILSILTSVVSANTMLPHPDNILFERLKRLSNPRLPNRTRLADNDFRTSFTGIVKNDFLLNDDAIGGTRQQNPIIAINNQSNIIVAWTDFRDGNADIYIQQMDTNNNYIGNNFRINTDATMMWQGSPSIDISDLGNIVVCWEDRRTYNSDVYLQRLNGQGQFIGDNIVVNDNIGNSDQRNCDVIILPNQEFVVVWDDWRNDWGDIFLQRFSSAGTRLGTNQRVNNDPAGNTQYYPSISHDLNSNFVITWMDGHSGNWDIYAQIYNNLGQPIGTNFLVNDNNSNNQTNPKVAVAGDGSFVIIWADERSGNSDIYGQRFDNFGNRIDSNFRVNDDANYASQTSPNVTIHPSGNFLVAWTDSRQNNPDIFAQFYNQSGAALGVNFKINDDLTANNQGAPCPAVISSGKFWLVWNDARNNNDDIYLQRLNANMTFLGTNQLINDDIASAHQRCSWITTDGSGNSIIAWEDERNTNCNIFAVRFDSLGIILNQNFQVNDNFISANYYPSVAADYRGNFIVTWCDDRNNNFDIYAQRYNQSGAPLGNNFRVNDDVSGATQWYPVVSCDSSGNTIIVWNDYRNNNYDIYGQLYDNQGNPLGTNFIISDSVQSDQLYATVARNRSGGFIVTWMDSRYGNFDIFAQRYTASGQTIGRDFLINDTLNNNYQGYPNLALNENGQFVIVWEDQRHYDTDIFLQKFSSDGNAIGNNIRVNSDLYNEEQYSPSVAFDRNGNYVVVWCYKRAVDDDPEIYAQAFNPAGQRIGNNVMVNQIDFFTANNQWLIGQGVSAYRNHYNFAWIDNRRHQGWDIYAKIISLDFFTDIFEQPTSYQPACLNIYPNPCYGKIFIRSFVPVSEFKIYNSLGQITTAPISNQEIDLSGYNTGIYFIKYKIQNSYYYHKIILSARSKNVK